MLTYFHQSFGFLLRMGQLADLRSLVSRCRCNVQVKVLMKCRHLCSRLSHEARLAVNSAAVTFLPASFSTRCANFNVLNGNRLPSVFSIPSNHRGNFSAVHQVVVFHQAESVDAIRLFLNMVSLGFQPSTVLRTARFASSLTGVPTGDSIETRFSKGAPAPFSYPPNTTGK